MALHLRSRLVALHVREPRLVRWWLLGLALLLSSRLVPFDIRLGTTMLAGVILFVLPIVGYRRISAAGGTYRLQQRVAYRIVLGGLALAAAVGMFIAANTFIVDAHGARRIGPIATAVALLAIAVLAWRSTVRPSPRGAALTSLVAMLAMMLASLVDEILQFCHLVTNVTHKHELVQAFYMHSSGLMLATIAVGWLTQLAGIAALVAFEPANETIPEARVSP